MTVTGESKCLGTKALELFEILGTCHSLMPQLAARPAWFSKWDGDLASCASLPSRNGVMGPLQMAENKRVTGVIIWACRGYNPIL